MLLVAGLVELHEGAFVQRRQQDYEHQAITMSPTNGNSIPDEIMAAQTAAANIRYQVEPASGFA